MANDASNGERTDGDETDAFIFSWFEPPVVHSSDRDRLVLAAVVFSVLFSQLLLYPGIATLVDVLGADAASSPVASTTLDASMWFLVSEFAAYVVFVGIWGAISDITGRRTPFIVLSAVAGAASYAALAVVPSLGSIPFEGVLLLRVLQGAMTIGALSLTMTMLMDLEGGHGRNMGAAGIAIGLGAATGAPIGGQLTELDPVAPLLAAATLLVCVGLLVSRLEDRTPASRRTARALIEGVRQRPTLSLPYAFGFVDRMTAGFFALVGTLYFQETFNLGPGATGLLLACFFAPFALLQYPLGSLSDRIGRTIPVVVGSACYGFGILGVGIAPSVGTAAMAMVVVGILGALVSPATMALVTDLADERERGTAMAGFNVAGSLGFLGGFLIGGSVAGSYGYDLAFLVVGGLEIIIALITIPIFLRLSLETGTKSPQADQ
ncbi:major facilitator superfamily protein [Natrialba magadii ATCC 43099]|uniref:Major facilitator superfamily protein n=1 Tax=Natrialba magadii (strain ATCC 43099 / DSM 3394 / CCM 3739 / CIP 104546 / IAM 13178 / JCM 8861 / NBRC 102185 / NCIMB 2190 / MS3) TaxID=547559 RepID=L9UWI9_NATMM|nr:major facilitator superfamily protein [Natrialba magadii ATCC 43099]